MVQPLSQIGHRARLGERVADELLKAIRLYQYAPGDKLPAERELAVTFEVSREAVREGLRLLEGQHYVEIKRGKYGGAIVSAPEMGVASDRIMTNPGQLFELLAFRKLIEPEAAALAAGRVGPEELAVITDCIEHMREEQPEPQYRMYDVRLHLTVARASGNSYVYQAVEMIRCGLAPGLDVLTDSQVGRERVNREHEELLEALTDGNADAVRTMMSHHILATERKITQALERLRVSYRRQLRALG